MGRSRRLLRRSSLIGLAVVALAVGKFVWFPTAYAPVGQDEVAVRAGSRQDRTWRECLAALEGAGRSLDRHAQVRLRFWKQERVGGVLGPVCLLETKQRRDPLGLYLRWVEPAEWAGREAIYEAGKRGGKMVAHEGGIFLNIAPTLLLDVDGMIAGRVSRYTLPEMSVWDLTGRSIRTVREAGADRDLRASKKIAAVRKRPATCYELVHAPGVSDEFGYHKLVIYIDRELMVPLRWEMYSLSATDAGNELQLMEYIEFDVPDFQPMLGDEDFDPANGRYAF